MKALAYKHYLLSVLLVILAFNYVDRLALGLVLQSIKMELSLSDTQLGLLSGLAFALFYSVMGIPIARWADRGNRVTIISITTLLWSGAVALCGLAATFTQLLLIRVGVAVGEAGCIPPAHSLIADHFTRAERPKAVSIYMLGAPLSMVIGYFLAGWLNEFYGWRATFVLLGLPGLLLAVVVRLTLSEPRNQATTPRATLEATPDGFGIGVKHPTGLHVCRTLWALTSFRHLLFGFAVIYFFGYGILQWQPAFFVRSYGMETGELGMWLALTYGVCGLVGTYVGGEWATRRAAHNEKLQLRAVAVACCAFGVFTACIYLSPNRYVAFLFMALANVGGAAINGPLFATIQTLVPPRMRAVSIATIYLFANFIGMGLGPLAAGALSDALRPVYGEDSLRYALLCLCPGYLWVGWHLWRASLTVARDLEGSQVVDVSAPSGGAALSP